MVKYRIAGIFRGGKFFVDARMICGKKSVVGWGLNHTPRACVGQWPLVSK